MAAASQNVLQAGLAAGMSTASGFHSDTPKHVASDYDGLQHVISGTPDISKPYILRGKTSNIEIPAISAGCWSYGDSATFHWDDSQLPGLQEAFKLAVTSGWTFYDTAQAYGSGRSEEMLGDLIRNHSGGVPREKLQIQTKWLPVITDPKNLLHPVEAPVIQLKKSLERLGLPYVDCYLVHGHIHIGSIKQVAQGLAECVDQGLTKTVGVANYSVEDMLLMQEELAKYGVPLATNQCEYSILRRLPETEGMLEACRKNNIIFQSYSSLGQGRLSGKYTKENPAPKEYRFSSYPQEHIDPIINAMDDLSKKYNKPISAIALNWNILKSAVPVVGFRKVSQVEENLQAFGWRLEEADIKMLDSMGYEGQTTRLWQQG